MGDVTISCPELTRLAADIKRASGSGFKRELGRFLEGVGLKALAIVQQQIIQRGAVDTSALANSFAMGGAENIWKASHGGATLEVGSALDYAQYVNEGHMANPAGVEKRFIPGYWRGARFVYDPGATTGMVLHQQYIAGYHFWESAIQLIEAQFPGWLERQFAQWLKQNLF